MRLTIALAVVLTACGGGATPITAGQVVDELQAAGIPLDEPALQDDAEAITATDDADVRVDVFGSPDEANDERLRIVDAAGGPGMTIAQCGPVLVTFTGSPDDDAAMVAYRRTAQDVLEQLVGEC